MVPNGGSEWSDAWCRSALGGSYYGATHILTLTRGNLTKLRWWAENDDAISASNGRSGITAVQMM